MLRQASYSVFFFLQSIAIIPPLLAALHHDKSHRNWPAHSCRVLPCRASKLVYSGAQALCHHQAVDCLEHIRAKYQAVLQALCWAKGCTDTYTAGRAPEPTGSTFASSVLGKGMHRHRKRQCRDLLIKPELPVTKLSTSSHRPSPSSMEYALGWRSEPACSAPARSMRSSVACRPSTAAPWVSASALSSAASAFSASNSADSCSVRCCNFADRASAACAAASFSLARSSACT